MFFIVIDNFFNNIENFEKSIEKIELYNLKDFNCISKQLNKKHGNENWAGHRSLPFSHVNPFLEEIVLNNLNQKTNIKFDNSVKCKMHLHLRLEDTKNKDWIHKDNKESFFMTFLIYLSKTNYDSGTRFYSEDVDNNDIIADVKFLKNRALIFDARYRHSAYGQHGDSVENGRLTLNAFFYKK
jgi:hypothetical protein